MSSEMKETKNIFTFLLQNILSEIQYIVTTVMLPASMK